ncbi:MAG: hypothetical protein HQ575_07025 [Candidatus Omnitrophica bacterium]|nr:hypothetical protein [Candidatus Omnitrophota bacterium]
MPNEPVVGKDFFGRREVLDILDKRVNALKEGYRQNVALTGQNLAGKSSILHYFLQNFKDSQILPIYVEITDEPFIYFCDRFIGSLLYNFLKLKNIEPDEDIKVLIEEARPYMPRSVKFITEIHDLIKRKEYDEAYSRLFDLTSVVKEEVHKSCVIILDEFHNLASLNIRYPFKGFGKKIMIQKDTMYIVTSSQVTTIKKILNEKLSLLFGNFEVIQVDGFITKDALIFLDSRLKYIRMPDEYKNFIISFTGCNPFYLDVISQALKDIVAHMTFKRVTQNILIEALEKTIFNSKGCISQYLNNSLEAVRKAKPSETYLAILLAVANSSCRLKEISKVMKKRSTDVSRLALDLIEMNILSKNGSFYGFVDKMLGFWLRHVYQKKRSAIISYAPDRIGIFHKEMGELIDGFMYQEKRDITDRVRDLFNLFANETVTLTEKEHKLPLFSSIETRFFANGRPFFLARTKNRYWLIYVCPEELKDIDIMEFSECCKALKLNLQRKIVISIPQIDTNARLMAKEDNIWLWDLETLNNLMSLYGKERIVSVIFSGRKRALA